MIDMKQCMWCKETKPLNEFTKNKREKDGYRRQCKKCTSTYERKRYSKDPSIKMVHNLGRNRRIHRNRLFICKYLLENPCVDCKESDPIVLEFDHVSDDKEYPITTLVCRGFSLSTIKKELKKCVVRCANCHRRKTFNQLGWYDKNSPQYDLTKEKNLKELIKLESKQIIKGSKHKNSKLKEDDVINIRKMISNKISDREIAKIYNVSSRLIFNIRKGIAWKHI